MSDSEARLEPPQPLPELREPTLHDPGLGSLSRRDYGAIILRAVRSSQAHHVTNLSAALAYSAFLTIPSVLLLALGVFGLEASPTTVEDVLDWLDGVVPPEVITLIEDPMHAIIRNQSGSIAMVAVGAVLALWAVSGAMSTLMWALNTAYDRTDRRGFVRKRLVALAMFLCIVLAVVLVVGLLVLGPTISAWVGDTLDADTAVTWSWWIAQWPIQLAGLLLAFASVYYLGPDMQHKRWQFVTPGGLVATVLWLAASGAFGYYTSQFASYNKTWGALAGVIITLTWLWISALALMFGAEINAEAERSREMRAGESADGRLVAPHKD